MSERSKIRGTVRYHWKAVQLWSLAIGGVCLLAVGSAQAATLESPAARANLSGLGFISGWEVQRHGDHRQD